MDYPLDLMIPYQESIKLMYGLSIGFDDTLSRKHQADSIEKNNPKFSLTSFQALRESYKGDIAEENTAVQKNNKLSTTVNKT
jgi:hypothetical protein